MSERRHRYGVLLPHFGGHVRADRLRWTARTVEELGFDSVWVRDHVVYHPHAHEDQDRTHLDPLLTLSFFAALTGRVALGTAILIPHRHPILSALSLGSIDRLAGPGRLIAGWGVGRYDHEFDAVGLGGVDRKSLLREHIDAVRALLSGDGVDFEGAHYRFRGVDVHPVPGPDRRVPMWYGGASPALLGWAAESLDGWIPGRLGLQRYVRLRARLDELTEAASRAPLDVGLVPYVAVGSSIQEAARAFDVPRLLEEARARDRDGQSYQSLEDLDGSVIAGPPAHIVEQVRRFQERGPLHLVFDLRAQFAGWEDSLVAIGTDVLPVLRGADDATIAPMASGRS